MHGSLSVKPWGLETDTPQSEGSLEIGQSIAEGGWGASQVAQVVRNPPANAGDMGSVSGSPCIVRKNTQIPNTDRQVSCHPLKEPPL